MGLLLGAQRPQPPILMGLLLGAQRPQPPILMELFLAPHPAGTLQTWRLPPLNTLVTLDNDSLDSLLTNACSSCLSILEPLTHSHTGGESGDNPSHSSSLQITSGDPLPTENWFHINNILKIMYNKYKYPFHALLMNYLYVFHHVVMELSTRIMISYKISIYNSLLSF